jgi:hypothetical protein
MILEAMPALPDKRRNGHQVIKTGITPLCRGPGLPPRPSRFCAYPMTPPIKITCWQFVGGQCTRLRHPPIPFDTSTGPLTSSLAAIVQANQNRFERINCVRDEEAAGSNPATPTQHTGHLRSSRVAFFTPYSCKVQQRL